MADPHSRITPIEFHHIRAELSSKGWSEHQLDQAESVFHDSLTRSNVYGHGIRKDSFDSVMAFNRAHPGASSIGPYHWDEFAKVAEKHF